jgi:hypothetical protein
LWAKVLDMLFSAFLDDQSARRAGRPLLDVATGTAAFVPGVLIRNRARKPGEGTRGAPHP